MIVYLSNIIITYIDQYTYAAILILMTLESFNLPIPSEIIMPFAGFIAGQQKINIYLAILFGAIGNVLGSLLSYFLAEWILKIRENSKILKKIIHEKSLNQSHIWFEKYGTMAVLLGRVIPIIRTFISLPAGVAKMPLKKFVFLTFMGSLVWSFILTYAGFKLGENWKNIENYFRKLDYSIIIAIAIIAIPFLLKYLKRRREKISDMTHHSQNK
jgi:membrane protein DedA with SNARE-associated domain